MNSLSLKHKIYAGFALMVMLLLICGIIPYFGLTHIRRDLEVASQIEEAHSTILQLDRDVQALALCVDRYVNSGQSTLIKEADTLNRRMESRITDVRTAYDDPKVNGLLDKIVTHSTEYENRFSGVVQEREVRQELLEEKLPTQSAEIQAAFRSLAQKLSDKQASAESRLALSEARANFSQAERSLLRYFESSDSQFVDDCIESLQRSRASLDGSDEVIGIDDSIQAKLSEYQRTGLRGVQATRSYLFFSNVVMAGESSEVSYYTSTLTDLMQDRLAQIDNQLDATSSRVGTTIALAVFLATAVGLITAIGLALSIVPPLTSLTTAFRILARGETVDSIPGVDRTDEIGQMAGAAQVFSTQNTKTKDLLAESERYAETLQLQAEQLKAVNEEVDNFAYVASHDLKSPLRGIRQLASWLEEDLAGKLTEKTTEYLQQLQSRVGRMESLLTDLLEFSRIGRLAPATENVRVSDMLGSMIAIGENPNGVEVIYSSNLPEFETAVTPFSQVMMNLIDNAIKHNHHQSGGRIEVDCVEREGHYLFSVSDNGPGIKPENHERVFGMYQRVGDPSVDGSGMGLAIVKKQVENFGGQVWVESDFGQGAQFYFTWPKEIVEPTDEDGNENRQLQETTGTSV